MHVVTDIARGDWIRPRLHGWGTVSSVCPVGYPAYARVFHPVAFSRVVAGPRGVDRVFRPTTWRAVATAFGTVPHPAMQWDRITRGLGDAAEVDGWEVERPRTGSAGDAVLAALAGLLPLGPCTVGVWSGWGGLSGGMRLSATDDGSPPPPPEYGPFGVDPAIVHAVAHGPLLALPGREYVLLGGALAELGEPDWASRAGLGEPGFGEPPNLVWPDDRSWSVATEIDFDSTIVGGNADVIDRILRSPDLEALPVSPDTDLSDQGDALSPG